MAKNSTQDPDCRIGTSEYHYDHWKEVSLHLPERSFIVQGFGEVFHIRLHMGNIVRIQTFGEQLSRKNMNKIGQWNDAFFGTRFKMAPCTNMRFRPEEIHGTSRMGEVFEPFPEGNGRISH